jgi:hypothetical protein
VGGERVGRAIGLRQAVGAVRSAVATRLSRPGRPASVRRHRRVRPHHKTKLALGVAVLFGLGALANQPAFAVAGCTMNAVACENTQEGTPATEWDDVYGAGDWEIQGYATDISVNVGQTVSFKIDSAAASYRIDIYRIGYYGGDGARLIHSITNPIVTDQDDVNCASNESTQIFDCGSWSVSASWAVPANAVSGVYIARLTRTDGPVGKSHIPFVVRNDASHSDLIFKTSDATWQAYNSYGGSNFYYGGPNGRSFKASYNRPFATRAVGDGRDFLFSSEYAMIRFLERNGYDVTYTTDVDVDRYGALLQNHKTFLSVGHDEYWSGNERTNVEAARDAGVNLAFFSGNEVYWKTRFESSVAGTPTSHRTLVCYKETWANAKFDTSSPEWTGTWRDPRFSPPSDGGRPENALTGTMYMSNNTDLAMQVPAAQGKYRFWRNTSVAELAGNDVATLAPHTVGYESDEDVDNGFRPKGQIRLSTTTGPAPEYLLDFGLQTAPGTTTHHMTLHRAPSGALVFGAGTIQWAWGLDDQHDGVQSPADPAMQQATINLLAEMGAQPATLMAGRSAAAPSSDTVAPSAAITSPANNAVVANGSLVTVSGAASDTGGVVAGVEVSTDGGTTWHPATGTTSWTYSFYSTGVGTQTVQARAIDDSVNVQPTPTSITVKLSGPSTLFGARVPKTPAHTDTAGFELGVKFTPQNSGTVTGVRFYKGTGNTGTHTGSLWSTTGTRLATGTFSGESATGWQTLNFSTPVQVNAGTTYVASYFAPNGRYAADERYFSYGDYKAPPLISPRSMTSGGNGLHRIGAGFPVTPAANDTNYYVDVVFYEGDSLQPSVLSHTPSDTQTNVDLTERPTASFSKDINASSISFTVKNPSNVNVPGTVTYNSGTRTATFTPSASLATNTTYTARVMANDTSGNPMEEAVSWTFTTSQYSEMSTLFAANATPDIAASTDGSAVTLGVKFTPQVAGKIVGVRYFQGAGNDGPHTGSLFTSTGTRLATATFNGGGTGWKSVYFDGPVTITPGTTYVAAYYAPNGHYAYTQSFFGAEWTNSDWAMSAPSGDNGLYLYGSDGFPTNAWSSSNYWVDPLFVTDAPPPGPPTQPNPPAGSETLFNSTDVPATVSEPDGGSIELGVKFTSEVAGQVVGVRFYKGSTNTGTHTATLWSATGEQLATGSFIAESASGWQTMLFSTPVTITAGTTYVVSYHTNVGYYSVNVNGFETGHDSSPLHVVAGGGSYQYGSSSFPSTAANHNYWVDPVFVPAS